MPPSVAERVEVAAWAGGAGAERCGFGLGNLPFGVSDDGRVVCRVGAMAVDLSVLRGLEVGPEVWGSGSLDALFALGPDAWAATRRDLRSALSAEDRPQQGALSPCDELSLVLPFSVADYVDFYASEHHVANVGALLRPGTPPIPDAWRHLPMGYHGRSGTVVASGSDIPRPWGVLDAPGGDAPGGDVAARVGPSARLDVEVEVGFVVGAGSERGAPVAVEEMAEHVFGVVLVDDWSARDIQAFEYRPLGPFLGKAFATAVSPWVVPLAALAPWAVPGPPQQPPPPRHLRQHEPRALRIDLELSIDAGGGDETVSRSSAAGLYWSIAQQVAHLTSGGASLRAGDLLASGTVSGPDRGSEGSFLELTRAGSEPLRLEGGRARSWIEDGDEVTIRGRCGEPGEGGWICMGEVRNKVVAGTDPSERPARRHGGPGKPRTPEEGEDR